MTASRDRKKSGIDRAHGLLTLITCHDRLARRALGGMVRTVLDNDDLHDALFECEYRVLGSGHYREERWLRRPVPTRRVTVRLRRCLVDERRWVEIGSLQVKPYRWLHDMPYVKRWLRRFWSRGRWEP